MWSRFPLTDQILNFLTDIGLPVRIADLAEPTFLPGVQMESGGLVVDLARLRYPGDLLHEAGHLALMEPARRASANGDAGADGGEEMGAIAWSYAAAIHLGLDPRAVFHPDGYRGGSDAIIENFAEGRYLGVPLLQWMGLTADAKRAADQRIPAYPHMLRWLRE